MNRNLIVLIVLLLLTAISVILPIYFAESKFSILLGAVKFLLIAYFFMEMGEANLIWRIGILSFILGFCLLI
ncbi:MAG: cytochrome C oxidase subunit IV family protein [Saprospiraceae bacterium]|jgi:hypothetical protein|nr:cytochrome C oxidase subunit IV family protein [Saprospiraceae bacterium]MBK9741809.1 cytochrome C oxidase subunit IV family protein [Saprospiraceae bacterium]MBP6540037.1 cytochrome C oxidase subunit IV family protein [Saprospiraceae bacterium]MBP9054887.1 cytochrome C oxidase subunit IV family protein [Saprospiraceae bacterium]